MRRMVVLVAAFTVGASLLATVGTLRPAAQASGRPVAATAALPPGTQFAAFAASVLTHPAPVRTTDGFVHIAYELVLTNVTPAAIRIDSVEVRNARTGRVLLALAGSGLDGKINLVGVAGAPESGPPPTTTTVASSESVIVWLDVRLRRWADVPAQLDHRVTATLVNPPPGAPTSITSVLTRVATVRHKPVALGPPVEPGIWLASEGCCSNATHHRRGLLSVNGDLEVPQRFAIDWFRLDAKHRAWIGDPHKLTSYLSYRQPVIAAANASVVDTEDGLPDNPDIPQPPPVPPIQDTVGNHVILKVAPGTFLLYAHLHHGSLRVHVGERVHRGQVLGLIGSSGNSTTPHLHFQVLTTPTFFPSDSPPYVFDRFSLLGQVTERIWDDNLGLQPTGTLPYVPASRPSAHRLELPLDRNVIRFPKS